MNTDLEIASIIGVSFVTISMIKLCKIPQNAFFQFVFWILPQYFVIVYPWMFTYLCIMLISAAFLKFTISNLKEKPKSLEFLLKTKNDSEYGIKNIKEFSNILKMKNQNNAFTDKDTHELEKDYEDLENNQNLNNDMDINLYSNGKNRKNNIKGENLKLTNTTDLKNKKKQSHSKLKKIFKYNVKRNKQKNTQKSIKNRHELQYKYKNQIYAFFNSIFAKFKLQISKCCNYITETKKSKKLVEHANQFKIRQNKIVYPIVHIHRSVLILLVMISIFTCDFKIFPERHQKSDFYGNTLMDVGIGAFLFCNGCFYKKNHFQNIKKIFSLLFLGFLRLGTLKSLKYPYNPAEYGTHLNFYFVLAAVYAIFPIIDSKYNFKSALILAIVWEYLLRIKEYDLWIFSEYRNSFINANKEGICGILGSLVIFMFANCLGRIAFYRIKKEDCSHKKKDTKCFLRNNQINYNDNIFEIYKNQSSELINFLETEKVIKSKQNNLNKNFEEAEINEKNLNYEIKNEKIFDKTHFLNFDEHEKFCSSENLPLEYSHYLKEDSNTENEIFKESRKFEKKENCIKNDNKTTEKNGQEMCMKEIAGKTNTISKNQNDHNIQFEKTNQNFFKNSELINCEKYKILHFCQSKEEHNFTTDDTHNLKKSFFDNDQEENFVSNKNILENDKINDSKNKSDKHFIISTEQKNNTQNNFEKITEDGQGKNIKAEKIQAKPVFLKSLNKFLSSEIKKEEDKLIQLAKFVIVFGYFYYISRNFSYPSRRLGNLSYTSWILFIHSFLILLSFIANYYINTEISDIQIFLSKNMMKYFLWSNLLILIFSPLNKDLSIVNCHLFNLLYLVLAIYVPFYATKIYTKKILIIQKFFRFKNK